MKRTAVLLLCGVMSLGLAACGRSEEKNPAGGKAETERTEFFPGDCHEDMETVKFDCSLEIPEEFDAENFYLPRVTGMQYIDISTAYKNYVEGKEVKESYHYPSEKEGEPDEDIYILADESQVSICGEAGFNWKTKEISRYIQAMRTNEAGASHDSFSFGTGESCIDDLKEKLNDIGFPTGEFRFSWFSLSGEEHKALEQEKLESGEIGEENVQEDWTDKNEYEIYAWQTYGGLQVLPQWMTTSGLRALESYQKAPVYATYTENGCLGMCADNAYKFEKTEEKISFLPFGKIVDAVEKRYENLLADTVSTVRRAKLVIRIYMDEKQEYAAAPVWYFEVADEDGNTEVLLFDAASGEEIYLS